MLSSGDLAQSASSNGFVASEKSKSRLTGLVTRVAHRAHEVLDVLGKTSPRLLPIDPLCTKRAPDAAQALMITCPLPESDRQLGVS